MINASLRNKTIMQRIPIYLKRIQGFFADHPIADCFLFALFMNIIIESLSHRSFFSAVKACVLSPATALCGFMIVSVSYLIAAFFKHRYFVFSIVSTFWLALSIINFVLQGYRPNPLGAIDFLIFKTGIHIINAYMSTFEIILVALAIISIIVLHVFFFKKLPKRKSLIVAPLCVILVLSAGIFAAFGSRTFKEKHNDFSDLPVAYRKYGFVYSFSRSIFDNGITEPGDYSAKSVAEILEKINSVPDQTRNDLNIIVVQLESFFDAKLMKNLNFSSDPVPNFTKLKETCPTGRLGVPSVGAGTANTEFEVLTGMSIDYFGVGEYPYKTILHDRTCESAAYLLNDIGYGTHAVHNHTGTFYDRNLVYPSLGFDTFTSIEYMNGYSVNPLGWACDDIILDEIIKSVNSTKTKDFVFAITVQSHGDYPDKPFDNYEIKVKVDGAPNDKLDSNWEYYATQLFEMDQFIGKTVEYFSSFDEHTVVVFYGDHMPSIKLINDENLDGISSYETEYVIWSNFGIEKSDADVEAYALMPRVFDLIGMKTGTMMKFHQTCADDEDYQNMLKTLEYDMLYGDNISGAGKPERLPIKMQMGIDEIKIYDVKKQDAEIIIIGSGFTPSSTVEINGHRHSTEYVSENVLSVRANIKYSDIISVAQVTSDSVTLSRTDNYIYNYEPFGDR